MHEDVYGWVRRYTIVCVCVFMWWLKNNCGRQERLGKWCHQTVWWHVPVRSKGPSAVSCRLLNNDRPWRRLLHSPEWLQLMHQSCVCPWLRIILLAASSLNMKSKNSPWQFKLFIFKFLEFFFWHRETTIFCYVQNLTNAEKVCIRLHCFPVSIH